MPFGEHYRVIRKALIAAFLLVLGVTVALLTISTPPVWLVGLLIGTTVLLILAVRWHARSTVYLCPACGYRFRVSFVTDFISPHIPGQKLLACPSCEVTRWCPEYIQKIPDNH